MDQVFPKHREKVKRIFINRLFMQAQAWCWHWRRPFCISLQAEPQRSSERSKAARRAPPARHAVARRLSARLYESEVCVRVFQPPSITAMQLEYDPEALIAEVRQRPGLWDYSHPDYREKKKKDLWQEIVLELMKDATLSKGEMHELELQLQKKWKSIRDCFQKYVINPKRTKRPYLYYKHLEFLLKDKKIPQRKRNMSRKDSTSSGSDDDHTIHKSRQKPPKASKLDSDIGKITEIMYTQEDNWNEDCIPHSEETQIKTNSPLGFGQFAFANVDSLAKTEVEDPEKLFLISLLPHLKSIPEEQRLNAKVELLQVLQRANHSIDKIMS